MGYLSNSESKGESPPSSSSTSSTNRIAIDSKKKRKIFRSRWPSIKKKCGEITTLCDVDAVLVCNFEGVVYDLPGSEDKFQEIVKKYHDQKGKRKRGFDSSSADDDGNNIINKKSKITGISNERFCPNLSEVSSMESLVEIGNRVESALAIVNTALNNRIHNEEQMVSTTCSGFMDDPTHSGGNYNYGFDIDEQNQGLLMNEFKDEQQIQHGSTSEYESASYSSILSNDDYEFNDLINSAFEYDHQNHGMMINELLCAR